METIMAEISQVQVLDGSVFNLKDSTARSTLENVSTRTPIALGVKSLTSSGGTVTWTSDNILSDSIVHVYASIYGITATDVSVTAGTLTATFPAASSSYVVNATVDGTATVDGGSGGGGSSSAGVSSFNGRSGVVTSQKGDYSFSLLNGTVALTQLPDVTSKVSEATTSASGLMTASEKTKVAKSLYRLDTKTLAAGDTTLTWTDSNISSDAVVDVYASIYGVAPTAMTFSGTTIIVTFKAQTADMDVCLMIATAG